MEFNNETDRRDYLRNEVIAKCREYFYATIKMEGITRTPVERRWFEVRMARELLKSQQSEVQMQLYAEEVQAAGAQLGDKL